VAISAPSRQILCNCVAPLHSPKLPFLGSPDTPSTALSHPPQSGLRPGFPCIPTKRVFSAPAVLLLDGILLWRQAARSLCDALRSAAIPPRRTINNLPCHGKAPSEGLTDGSESGPSTQDYEFSQSPNGLSVLFAYCLPHFANISAKISASVSGEPADSEDRGCDFSTLLLQLRQGKSTPPMSQVARCTQCRKEEYECPTALAP